MKTFINSHFLFQGLALAIASMLYSACSHSEKATVTGPVAVTVQQVRMGDSNGSKSFSGTVESSETTSLSFSVPGTISDIYVGEGQRVVKGQTLARVKSGNYVNAASIADAELAEARDAYARLKKLHDADALPDIKWVEVQNKLKQAENAAEISRRAVSDATLKAPSAGVISRKIASVGQTVIAAEPVLELVAMNDLRVAVSVPEGEIGGIVEGQKARVAFKELGIDSVGGRVVQKSVVADPLTRAYTVKVSIPNADGRILPGMVGDVTLERASDAGAGERGILLPSQAVLLGSDNRRFVWVVKDGKAERRFVTADNLSSGGILITGGLSAEDSVIVAGMQKVGTGTAVKSEAANK